MPEITVLLLNYKRPHNIPKILDSLKSQTVPVKIFLWDNSGDTSFSDPRIDLVFRASENQGCSPRWVMGLYAETKYIMTHDDDFLITKNNILEEIISCLDSQEDERTIVGLEGIVVDKNRSYEEHIGYENRYKFKGNKYGAVIARYGHIKNSERVHFVKGRLIAIRTENLRKYVNFPLLLSEREDDITVCSMVGKGERIHLIPIFFKDCIQEIPDQNAEKAGNKDKPEHANSRNTAFSKYFTGLQFDSRVTTINNIEAQSSITFKEASKKNNSRNEIVSEKIKFVIIAPFRNADFLEKCMQSVEQQVYKNYIFVGIDDCSGYEYSEGVKRLLNNPKFIIIKTEKREYALKARVIGVDKVAYHYGGIADEDVIVHLDGDDWFADEYSLSKLAEAYSDDTLVTYGGAMRLQEGQLLEPYMHALSNLRIENRWGRKVGPRYPEEVIANRDYRNYPWGACHCRTFKYKLYKQIYRCDFLDKNGEYIKYGTDMAIFLPVLEMAGSKVKYLEDNIYIYNRDTGGHNVASEFKDQHQNHNFIRSNPIYPVFMNEAALVT